MLRITASLALCMLVSINAFSQSPDTLLINQFDLEEITVTANKQEEKLIDIPASLSMVSAEQVQNKQVHKLNDLTSVIPNLYMPDYGTQLTSPIYIRGIGTRIKEPSVGLYVDGVPRYDKGTFDFHFMDIEKVEVLRGPQGTLYGRNTMGGLIHVQTREPQSKPGTQLKAMYGNYNKQKYALVHHQPLGEKFALKLSGQYFQRKGYFENAFTRQPVDDMNTYQGDVKLKWEPQKNISLNAGFHYGFSENQGFAYKNVGENENHQEAEVAYDYPSGYYRNLLTGFVRFKHKMGKSEITSISSMQQLKDEHLVDQDFTTSDLFRVGQDRAQNLFSQELRYNLNIKDFSVVAGLYGFFMKLDKEVLVEYGSDAAALYSTPEGYNKKKNYLNKNFSGAAFGQVTWHDLLPLFDVIAGIRWDHEFAEMDYEYKKRIGDNPLEKQDTLTTASFQQWMPKFTVRYRLPGKGNIYASVSKGYKSGGFNSTFESAEHISYEAEYNWNYEIGTRLQLFRKRLKTNLALFYIDWDNQQIYQPVPSGMGSMITNAGESKSMGFELETSIRASDNLSFSGSIGYTEAKFLNYERYPDKNINYKGNYLPYVPRFNTSAGIRYKVLTGGEPVQSVKFGTRFQYTDKQFWTADNEYSQAGYGLLNANISAQISSFTLSLWGRNLTNTSYQAFFFEALGNHYVQSGKPRLIGLTLTFNGLN